MIDQKELQELRDLEAQCNGLKSLATSKIQQAAKVYQDGVTAERADSEARMKKLQSDFQNTQKQVNDAIKPVIEQKQALEKKLFGICEGESFTLSMVVDLIDQVVANASSKGGTDGNV